MAAASLVPPESRPIVAPQVLQWGLAACFVGHGMLGLRQTAAWASYFAVAGVGPSAALSLMPWIGALDVALAVMIVLHPWRPLAAYMAAWAVWTALLRPLAGESAWEAIERAGNYGVPIAVTLLLTRRPTARWFEVSRWRDELTPSRRQSVEWTLRLTTFGLLLGHGALGLLVHKPLLLDQYSALGLPGSITEQVVGGAECALALAVLIRPARSLLLLVFGWKLASEALNPLNGLPVWVFVEHGGSYAAPLALALLRPTPRRQRTAQLATA